MFGLGLVLLGGHTAPGPPSLHVYYVDRVASALYVVTHKAGLLAFLGHEHAITPWEWSAELCLADPMTVGAHGSVTIDVASLVVDSDSARTLAGLGRGPGEDDRRKIQDAMLDSAHLAAVQFPEVRLELEVVDPPERDAVIAHGALSLRGVTRDVQLPIGIERADDGVLLLSGTLRIRQRDFGIEPESTAGLVKVSNDVDLHFMLAAQATESPCEPRAP
jgi:polyisoprenoid-binding protein YceI